MRILLVGLNPSPAASEAGVGFARPGNRFWPALLASGLATVDRDPVRLLGDHGIGMTDLVKRTTARASELSEREFADGIERLERLVGWLRPGIVCFVGLQGWRAAIDKRASAGAQSHAIGGRPTYVMPNPSGLNANHQVSDFVEHFRAVAERALGP
jgi:TDG/mug DNA glycosylase family protein